MPVHSQPTHESVPRVPGLALALVAAFAAASLTATQAGSQFVTSIDWEGRGTWLRAELHTHTQFSDGVHPVDTVVAAAQKYGCDVVAITDHSDRSRKARTAEFVDAIREARARHPALTVMTGMEWNVPPGKGTEHATILFPSTSEGADVLLRIKEQFDDRPGNDPPAQPAAVGLASLLPADPWSLAPVVFFNHPSRFPDTASAPRLTFEALRAVAPSVLIGIEGGPGHQRAARVGLYPEGVMTGRWDPLLGQVGGAWDRWLQQGLDVWGAIATSDFHDERVNDYWPCEFSSTTVYSPDRTVDGVIRAMRAGSFFAEHGHIVSSVALRASLPGLPRPAEAGESVSAPVGATATVSLHIETPATDYLGRANRIDAVELIAISRDKADVVFSGPPTIPAAFSVRVTVPRGGLVLRARGRRNVDGEPPLMFYTNPIRITASAG